MRRMLRIALLIGIILSLTILDTAFAVINKVDIPKGGSSFNNAVNLEVGKYYYINVGTSMGAKYAFSNKVLSYYSFTTQETGNYSIFWETVSDNHLYSTTVKLYDMYEKCLTQKSTSSKEVMTLSLDAGYTYYLYIETWLNEWSPLKLDFAICSSTQHAVLSDMEIKLAPTCTGTGYFAQSCQICGAEVSKTEIPATGHTPGVETVLLEPTCISKGQKGIQCTTCGTILESEELPLVNHTYGKMQTVYAATCTESGYGEQRCRVCDTLLNSETIPATGHNIGDWKMSRESTCVQSGLREKKCVVCGMVLESEELPALGHEYTEWDTVKDSTKWEEGEKRRHCIRCGDTQSEVIPKKPKFLGIF